MNFRMIFKSIGSVLFIEACFMLPSLLVSLIYGQGDASAFIKTILILCIAGLALNMIKPVTKSIYARDGFAIVSFGWMIVSFFGALPFIFSGAIPSFIDAIFESVSGFTTTGSTILTQVENLPRGILFWRSFTHFIGGMGVLVLTLAVLPYTKADNVHILRAESPGPDPEKLVPKIGRSSKILYAIYIVMTVILVAFLILAGMPLYDSLIHALGTAGTGGFSSRNISVGAYNNIYAEVIIMVFMLLFGINFALYYQALKGNTKAFFRNNEFRFFLGVVLLAILAIAFSLRGHIYNTFGESLRHASFQVSSIITTTGYSTTDFNLWPTFSKVVLVLLMFIGASAGSTGGGIKCIRILVLLKIAKREILKIIHPRSVYTVKIDGKSLDENKLSTILSFFFAYIAIFVASVLVVSLDGKDLVSTFTAVAASINNVGPGFELVGPPGSFADFSAFSKIVCTFCMIVGRLEIFPVLMIFVPAFWKKVNI
jgi:trk system potassium uptake protein TrkH